MSKKINQHYVPQFYFRLFSADQRSISMITRDSGALISHAPIKGQASKSNFYGHKDIENSLSSMEAIFSTVLREIIEQDSFFPIAADVHSLLLQNIVLQRTRTQSARNNTQVANDTMMRLSLEVEINNNETLTEFEKDELISSLEFMTSCPENFQAIAMSQIIEIAKHLRDLKPLLLVNKTRRPFIFSDAPVIFCNPLKYDIADSGVIGAKSFGLIIYYPLTPDKAVLLVDEFAYKISVNDNNVIKIRGLKDISSLNMLQIHSSAKAVYFSDMKYANYVRDLWGQVKKTMINHCGGIYEHELIEQIDGTTSQIIQFFERQVPHKLQLSFINTRNFPQNENYPQYRDEIIIE